MLPFPKIYTSAMPIPFLLSFASNSPHLPYILSHLSVRLLKRTTIRAGGFVSSQIQTVAIARISPVDTASNVIPPLLLSERDTPGYQISRTAFCGRLVSSREDRDASWEVPNLLKREVSIFSFNPALILKRFG
jgi:hypothetical protein